MQSLWVWNNMRLLCDFHFVFDTNSRIKGTVHLLFLIMCLASSVKDLPLLSILLYWKEQWPMDIIQYMISQTVYKSRYCVLFMQYSVQYDYQVKQNEHMVIFAWTFLL